MNFEANSSNDIDKLFVARIRKGNDETKVNFIKDLISQTDIPSNITVLKGSSLDKIYYRNENGKKIRRE